MKIAIVIAEPRGQNLATRLAGRLPEADIHIWPDERAKACEFAVIWNHPPGLFSDWSSLQAVMSYGAGVDFIAADSAFPRSVPVARMIDPTLASQMSGYLAAVVMPRVRELGHYRNQQSQRCWKPQSQPNHGCIGFLGLGHIGSHAARLFSQLGFRVMGWKNRPVQVDGVQTHWGEQGLIDVVSASDFLVCTLPLTDDTAGILNRQLFEAMPSHACLINVGRGAHVVDSDLLMALDQGELGEAVLDVFHTEPLPEQHPFWTHSKVTVTPHIASLTDPDAAADQIADSYRSFRNNGILPNQVDLTVGY